MKYRCVFFIWVFALPMPLFAEPDKEKYDQVGVVTLSLDRGTAKWVAKNPNGVKSLYIGDMIEVVFPGEVLGHKFTATIIWEEEKVEWFSFSGSFGWGWIKKKKIIHHPEEPPGEDIFIQIGNGFEGRLMIGGQEVPFKTTNTSRIIEKEQSIGDMLTGIEDKILHDNGKDRLILSGDAKKPTDIENKDLYDSKVGEFIKIVKKAHPGKKVYEDDEKNKSTREKKPVILDDSIIDSYKIGITVYRPRREIPKVP